MTTPATFESGSKKTMATPPKEQDPKRLDERRRPGTSQTFVLPIHSKSDKVEEELRAVIKMMGRLRLADK